SEQMVREFWENNPYLFTPMALKRVIRLTLTPSNTVPMPAQTRLEMDQVLAKAAGLPVTVPVEKRELLDEERDAIVYDTLQRTEDAFTQMAAPPREPNFYSDEATTGGIESLMEMDSFEVPSLEGIPSPGLDEIEAPDELSTDT